MTFRREYLITTNPFRKNKRIEKESIITTQVHRLSINTVLIRKFNYRNQNQSSLLIILRLRQRQSTADQGG
jgi:hypothetical protein